MLALLLLVSHLILLRSLKVLPITLALVSLPDYEVNFTSKGVDDGWLVGLITITAVETTSIILGGRFRLFDRKNRKILDMPLGVPKGRPMIVGQGFHIPVRVRVPMGMAQTGNLFPYSGYVRCTDSRSLKRFKIQFGDGPGSIYDPFLQKVGRLLLFDRPFTNADAGIVLDGGDFDRRLAGGIGLLRRNYIPHLFVCLSNYHRSHHEQAQAAAREMPGKITQVTSSAVSTWQEASAIRPEIMKHHCASIVVVTSWYHTRRAQMIFERHYAKDGIKVSACAIEAPSAPRMAWWKTIAGAKQVSLEALKLFSTWLRLELLGPPNMKFRIKTWTHESSGEQDELPSEKSQRRKFQLTPLYVSGSYEDSKTDSLPNSEGACRKVLVIEEESAIRNLVYGLVSQMGCETDSVKDGQEALAKLRKDNYDSVLLDLRSPAGNAESVIPEIHRISPALVGRVLVITADVANEQTLRMIEENFAHRITGHNAARDIPLFLRRLLRSDHSS